MADLPESEKKDNENSCLTGDIVVSEAMIEQGIAALQENINDILYVPRDLVVQIYLSMEVSKIPASLI